MQATSAPDSVLIADAEPTICRVFEAKLTKEGRFRVVCASTGADACVFAPQNSFDVLLWDLRIRDSDRWLPQLRALCPDAVLLLMSTDDRPVVSSAVSCLNVADVLIKPFGLDTLQNRVLSALSERQSHRP